MAEEIKNPEIKEKKELSKTLKIILLAITVAALLMLIGGLNRVHLNPFRTSTDSRFIYDKCTSDAGGVTIDSQGKRLLFLDSSGKLINVVDVTMSGSPINKAIAADIVDGEAVIRGIYSIKGGIYISSDSLVHYSLSGNYIGETDRHEYAAEDFVTEGDIETGERYYDSEVINVGAVDDAEKVSYGTWYMIKNILYWLSALWIGVLALLLLVWLIKNKLTRKTLVIAIGIGCILFTAVYYTISDYRQIRSTYENEVVALTKQSKAVIEENLNESIKDCYERLEAEGAELFDDPEVIAVIDAIENKVKSLNTTGTLHGCCVQSYVADSKGTIYTAMDSRGIITPGTIIHFDEDELEKLINHNIDEVEYVSDPIADLLTDYSLIHNRSGNIIGFVMISAYEDNILAQQSERGVNSFVNLLAIFIGIYMVGNLIIIYSDDLKRWASRDKSDIPGRAADMSGIYTFIFKLASTVDSVIVVYVAADLCKDVTDPVLQAALVALPLTSYNLGRWVGTFFATPCIKKFGERKTGVLSCIVGIAAMLLTVFAINGSNIYIYAAAKFINAFVLAGTMFVLSDTLPLCATSDEQRTKAMNSSQQSTSAAGIIIALVSGYISQYVGYSVVYLLGAAMCVLLLLVTVMIYGSETSSGNDTGEKQVSGSTKDYWTIFLKPEMLMYLIFYILPSVLTGGYNSYLFPLYSAGAGISVVLLSNISVFSKTLMYVTNDPISKWTAGMDQDRLMIVPNIITCIGLICFLISPNIYWAIIMLFAGGILDRMAAVSKKMYRVRVAEHYNLDATLVTSNFYTVQSALYILQSPALSAFIALGMNLACAAVGLVSGIGYAIFGGYTKKHKL